MKGNSATASMCLVIFSISATEKTNLPYERGDNGEDAWSQLRHQHALTTEAVLRLAEGSGGTIWIPRLQAEGWSAGWRTGDGDGDRLGGEVS